MCVCVCSVVCVCVCVCGVCVCVCVWCVLCGVVGGVECVVVCVVCVGFGVYVLSMFLLLTSFSVPEFCCCTFFVVCIVFLVVAVVCFRFLWLLLIKKNLIRIPLSLAVPC